MKKKKSAVLIIVIFLAIGVSVIGVFAAGQIARANSISEATAIKIACADAEVKEAGITVSKNEFRGENGIYFYEIEFISDGIYRYKVNARTGQIIEKTIPEKTEEENRGEDNTGENKTGTPVPDEMPPAQDMETAAQGRTELQTQNIGVEKAKKIALEDAGVNASEIVFSKAKQEKEEDRTVYRIEFFKSGVAEYEYRIDAFTGKIVEREREDWENDDALIPEQQGVQVTESQTTGVPEIENPAAEQPAETPADSETPASTDIPASTEAPENLPVTDAPSSEDREEEPEEADDDENEPEEEDQEEPDDDDDESDDDENDDDD